MSPELANLLELLGDSDVNVRLSAADALRQIGKPAVEPLCEIFTHGSKDARWTASSVLGKIADVRAVQPLCQALGDSDPDIRACAVCALGEIGSPAVAAACQMLDDDNWLVRACAANALARIGDARATKPLCEAIRRIDSPIRKFMSWAFAGRIDFAWGVRQTARAAEAEALKKALLEIENNAPNKALQTTAAAP